MKNSNCTDKFTGDKQVLSSARKSQTVKQASGIHTLFKLLLVSLICMTQMAQAQYNVRSIPSTVQKKRASLRFFGETKRGIPADIGWIRITVPDTIEINKETTGKTPLFCRDEAEDTSTCKVTFKEINGRKTFEVISDRNIPTGQSFDFTIGNAIDNPMSRVPTEAFPIYSSEGWTIEEIETQSLQATAGNIKDISFIPDSKVVGASTTLVVKLTPSNTIPKGGSIRVEFPKWNSNAKPEDQKNYIQGAESCQEVLNLANNLSCRLQQGNLIVENITPDEDLQAGTPISFKISGFKNPIQTGTHGGFKIRTQVRDGKEFYSVDEGEGSITIDQFASLQQAQIIVDNEQKEDRGVIQALNIMRMTFFLPVPLDKGFRITVTLPSQYNIDTVTEIKTSQVFGFSKNYYRDAKSGKSTFTAIPDLSGRTGGSLEFKPCQDTYDVDRNKICEEWYVNDGKMAVIRLFNLQHYKYAMRTQESFKIKIESKNKDADGNYEKIARIESGVYFKPIGGQIAIPKAYADDSTVWATTDVTLVLKPQHNIYADDGVTLLIELPPQIKIDGACRVESVQVTGSAPAVKSPKCIADTEYKMKILKFIDTDYIADETNTITIKLGEITNPASTAPVEGFRISILVHNEYLIDQYFGQVPWPLTTGTFTNMVVQSESDVAYQPDNKFTITFNPNHIIPRNGFVEVAFPREVIIPDTSYSASQCAIDKKSAFGGDPIVCEFSDHYHDATGEKVNDGLYKTLRIYNGFRSTRGMANKDYTLYVPGIRNPIRVGPTPFFKFATFTRSKQAVDMSKPGTGGTLVMNKYAEMTDIQINPTKYINSTPTDYVFTIVPTVPIQPDYMVQIHFPKQITFETDHVPDCSSNFIVFVEDSMTCEIEKVAGHEGQTMLIRMNFKSYYSVIKPHDRFQIRIRDVTNPISTKTTDSFKIHIVDKDKKPVNIKDDQITITTGVPYPIDAANASITPKNPWPGVESEFDIEFTPKHQIQKDGGILIVYPPQITPDPDNNVIKTVVVTVDGMVIDQDYVNVQHSAPARSFIVKDVIQGKNFEPSTFKKIQVTIKGLRNPRQPSASDSFLISTFDHDVRQNYLIDQVGEGLIIKALCAYPCKDCLATDKSECTECFSNLADGLKYLQLGRCVDQCATGRYYNTETQHCDLCDDTCLDCEGASDKCTACGKGDYLFLFRNTCRKDCEVTGFLANSKTNMCDPCHPKCKTCDKNPTKCTSCHPKKNRPLSLDPAVNIWKGKYPLFYRDDCREECPSGIAAFTTVKMEVARKGVKQPECVQCDASCKTCIFKPTTCKSCEDYMAFDKLKGSCSQMCKPNTQIFRKNLNGKGGYCLNCDIDKPGKWGCLTCEKRPGNCTSCSEGSVLSTDENGNGTCLDKCMYANQVAINGVCKKCEEPCATCEGTTKSCTGCLNDYLLFKKSKCVQYCPKKYSPNKQQRKLPEFRKVKDCKFEGLVCPDNFEINKTKDGCVPKTFFCPAGYQINASKTACVPSPGSIVPFPFILSAIFMCFIVLGSWLKDKFFTKVITCLIALIGSFEVLMYTLMVIFSAILSEWTIFFFSAVGLATMIASNVIFFLYYRKDVLAKDEKFAAWIKYFPRMQKFAPVICLLLNFKCFKMFYGGFFGLETFQATFTPGRGQNAVYRTMRMVQFFSYVFSYTFIYIADIIIFVRAHNDETIKQRQLFILGIETLILQTLMIVLIQLEMRQNARELLGSGSSNDYSQLAPDKGGVLKVQGGIGGFEEDYDEGLPDMDENTLIRSREAYEQREINMRKQALVKILKQVSTNFNEAQQKGVDIGGDIDDCMTKFDAKKLKMRRAFSDKGNSVMSWQAEGESEEEENMYGDEQPYPMLEEGSLAYDGSILGDGGQDFNMPIPQRRNSYPLMVREEREIEIDPMFIKHVDDIKEAAGDYLIDNCLTDVLEPVKDKTKKKVKTVSRRTQTYLRELLTVEGEEIQESDMEVLMEEEAEIEDTYAMNLINNVIERLSDEEESNKDGSMRGKPKVKPVKKQAIPEFELSDIMGEFEIDDLGNFIIIRGPNGELMDKRDRRVNRRGYLVDRFGNVINQQGNVIFKAVELDIDDEIPAPFGFEKRKAKLLQLARENQFKIEDMKQSHMSEDQIVDQQDEDEDMLDKELQEIRGGPNKQSQQSLKASTIDQKSRESNAGEHMGVHDDMLDHEIDMATVKHKPRKKTKLRKGNQANSGIKYNNPPPRRIREGDANGLFPLLGIENDEQRRLAKIANHIGGMANQLAEQQRGRDSMNNQELQLTQQQISDQERLDWLRQQQLRELAGDGNIASLNDDFSKIEAERRSFMIQERPGALQANNRMQSAQPLDRSRYGGQINMNAGPDALSKVYGNIVDLTNLEEQQLIDLMGERKGHRTGGGLSPAIGTGGSRYLHAGASVTRGKKKGPTRAKGLENIYLKKFNSRQGTLNGASGNISMSNARANRETCRPTMFKFENDPAELIADTEMNEQRNAEPSVIMADRIDHIKRQYLSSSNAVARPQSQAHLSMMQQQQMMNMSGRQEQMMHDARSQRFIGAHTPNQLNMQQQDVGAMSAQGNAYYAAQDLDQVKQGNWVDEDDQEEEE